MHPNPIYRTESDARNLSFAAEVGFGAVAVSAGEAAPLVAQAPFVIEGEELVLHLMRSNPVARAAAGAGCMARVVVNGPHGYVSPDWYGIEGQVPTWNYVSVHLTGRLEVLPQARMRAVLEQLSEACEARLLPKPIWKTGKLDSDALERMMRMIQPLRMRIEGVEGTWKLSQNKPDAARLGAAEAMAETGFGAELDALAALMRAAVPVR